MSISNIQVAVDEKLRKEAEDLFNDLGLSMSTAVSLFLKAAVSQDGLPFSIQSPPSKEILQEAFQLFEANAIQQGLEDLEKGHTLDGEKALARLREKYGNKI
ncbi:type II toxin-antitoxin system RelB/DinJ family antitoxin [Peptococcus simiae]|uniref:type II toxin-antitoxin system RelB/DinJ family antitoxin n=1 Tax=Peptococcus simiae TaxID=1643805 RepID=UPI00397F9FD7